MRDFNRLWELRETSSIEPKFGRKHSMIGRKEGSIKEAYECGYEEGYRAAMIEAKRYYED